jgi:predicted GNAT family N-acyltransferase
VAFFIFINMIEQYLSDKYKDELIALDVYEDAKSLKLSRIIINPEFRGGGVGTDIMTDLINYADKNKKIITLTPSSDFGGNKNRLVQFYKRFGFKLNKGVHKSYEYMDSMIRWPKINQLSESKQIIKLLLRNKLFG